ncbi:glutathione S-transferase family protein [Xanthomonas sp. A2111]|uniref:Glutathione S-transferase family protein n=1 Tax=Xanthomonas hawaiiensis TaxID=3003247 RepID=A0ABU2IAM9_9XANT|nr:MULTISPECIES: glutathione S-transferase family protein [unclassified Xanthomonas]MBO9829048.1 glutathione S-transferase family protein [Xanthomonas sp. A2111]MBO9874175.1 glutathione S-transferase family protein [Xanthomonas sp. D-93]MDS9994880.1 glutathione S-transferase family protein [Xanthomonas sp. A2111]WNH46552.1 glutathione S-transferase family protein [Xanthomonas sp. A6251]
MAAERFPLTVYGMALSGNCYKVRLLLDQLGCGYRWVEVDSANGQTRTPAFLAKNPNGKVPLLEREDGRVLAESNAILCWLAEGTGYLPADPWQRAQALSWLFFEQYSHEPYVAVARFVCGWTPPDSPRRAELPRLREGAMRALAVMEQHLQAQAWFTGPAYGIADIALFAYTHCAGDAGIALAQYPALCDWLQRVRATPGFVALPPLPEDVRARLALAGTAAAFT